MANGTKSVSVITSCRIFSCASDTPPANPMRLAGTCSRYSKRAMPQLTSAARYQGVEVRYFRWPYHANVMNRFDAASSVTVVARVWMVLTEFLGEGGTGSAWGGPRHRPGGGRERASFAKPRREF